MQRVCRITHPPEHRGVNGGAESQADLVDGHGVPQVRAGLIGMANVKGHGQIGIDVPGGDLRPARSDLFLRGCAEHHAAVELHAGERLHRHEHRYHTGAVVKGLVGRAVVHQLRHWHAKGNGVAHAHELLHLFLRQPHVHRQIGKPRRLERAVVQMRGLCADHAIELFPPEHRHLAPRQNARVDAAHLPDAQKAVVFNAGDDHAHLVHVGADQHRRAVVAHHSAHISQFIDANVAGIFRKLLRDAAGNRALHARVTGHRADFLQKCRNIHPETSF